MSTDTLASDAVPIANDTPVLFRAPLRRRAMRGHVRGTRTEPDGSLTYQIWDGNGFRYIPAGDVRPLRNRRRGK